MSAMSAIHPSIHRPSINEDFKPENKIDNKGIYGLGAIAILVGILGLAAIGLAITNFAAPNLLSAFGTHVSVISLIGGGLLIGVSFTAAKVTKSFSDLQHNSIEDS